MASVLVLSSGCDDKYVFPNDAPSQLAISYIESYIIAGAGSEVELFGDAVDVDGDPLYYQWIATAGTFEPADARGQHVVWIPPKQPAIVTITLIVTDEIEESRTSITIEVGRELPHPASGMVADSGFVYIVDVVQPFNIAAYDSLTLMEGVRVVVLQGGFDVDGTMILSEGVSIAFMEEGIAVGGGAANMVVHGAAGNEVIIETGWSGSVQGEWDGIRLSNGAEGDFSHLRVFLGENGIIAEDPGTSLELDNCAIMNSIHNGIEIIDGARGTIRACVIDYNNVGIYVRNSTVDVKRSALRYNRDMGMEMSASNDSYEITIDSCSVSNNGDYGFELTGSARPEIHYCSIFGNGFGGEGYGVHLESYLSSYTIMATNNFWGLGKDTAPEISLLIWDKNDVSSLLGEVIFDPWENSVIEGAPLEVRTR